MTDARAIAATVALVRHLAGNSLHDFPAAEFAPDLDWEEVVAFASAHLVLPALHPVVALSGIAIPGEAADFLQLMHGANAARNVELYNGLLTIGAALNVRGIVPVLLKGASVLVTDAAPPSAWRFLSDLDLLVPANQLATAVAALADLGFAALDADYDEGRDAHYPALIAPGGRFAIELHTRVLAGGLLPILEARLPAEAEDLVADGVRFRVPALADRIAHLIGHAQLHHGHHGAHRLLLRGFLELSMISGPKLRPNLWQAALLPFAGTPGRRAATAYLAAWNHLMAPGVALPAATRADAAWVTGALARLHQGGRLRLVAALLAAGRTQLARTLSDSAVLRRHVRTLASPAALRARIGRHRQRLRQAYWV